VGEKCNKEEKQEQEKEQCAVVTATAAMGRCRFCGRRQSWRSGHGGIECIAMACFYGSKSIDGALNPNINFFPKSYAPSSSV
jgi:hypothetical protein